MTGILIVDKPRDWTSSDVVCKLRGMLHERRVGHSGTLDPMATGVLPVFIGRATRAVEFCESDEKEYIAGIRLGIETDTQDTTGTVLHTWDCTADEMALRAVLPEFTGRISQLPPMYSAVKVGGKKLYELARRGVELERTPRQVTIRVLELLSGGGDTYTLRVVCSKGTYIRTLCHEIGRRLGCGAAMCALRRVRAGSFSIGQAVTLEEVSAAVRQGCPEKLLMPVDSVFSQYPAVTVSGKKEKMCRNGADFSLDDRPDGRYRVYNENGLFLMVGKMDDGIMHTEKSFFEV